MKLNDEADSGTRYNGLLRLGMYPRKVARWRSGKDLPDLYETQGIVEALRVSEDLFRSPPEVPSPPAYPIERYLLGAADQGARRGLSGADPDDEDDDAPDEPTLPQPPIDR